jgi:hypothetical protein
MNNVNIADQLRSTYHTTGCKVQVVVHLVVGVAVLLLNTYICTILHPRYHLEDRQKEHP